MECIPISKLYFFQVENRIFLEKGKTVFDLTCLPVADALRLDVNINYMVYVLMELNVYAGYYGHSSFAKPT